MTLICIFSKIVSGISANLYLGAKNTFTKKSLCGIRKNTLTRLTNTVILRFFIDSIVC